MIAPPQKHGIGVAIGALVLVLSVVSGPAGAGPIDEKRAEAAAIAAKLDSQAGSIVALDKERRRAQDALVVAETAVARAQDDLAIAGRRQDEARRLLAAHAQAAYAGGGTVSFIGRMARASVDDAAARRAYLQTASGEDRMAIGRLRAAQEDIRASEDSLERARQTAAGRAKATNAEKQRMDAAVSTQRALLIKVNGDLGNLVAAEQSRQDAETAKLMVASAVTAAPATAPARTAGTAAPGGSASVTTTPATTTAPSRSASSSTEATFACIRQLESGNNYSSPGGGAYQFQDATWQSLGYKGSAQDAPPAVQDEAARKLQARDGWAPWTTAPLCGRV